MRNSLLAECGSAPIMYGGSSRPPKHGTRDPRVPSGRGALSPGRSRSASSGGLATSEDAGISSDKTGENPVHRKPKVSAVQFVCCRSVGPKARPFGVVDGCQVYIPEPGVKAKLPGTLSHYSIQLLVCWSRKGEAKPSGGAEVVRWGGREKPSRYNTSDRTAIRHM